MEEGFHHNTRSRVSLSYSSIFKAYLLTILLSPKLPPTDDQILRFFPIILKESGKVIRPQFKDKPAVAKKSTVIQGVNVLKKYLTFTYDNWGDDEEVRSQTGYPHRQDGESRKAASRKMETCSIHRYLSFDGPHSCIS